MRVSRRFINFAVVSCFVFLLVILTGCKGRTIEGMQPTGDTVELVIHQDTIVENNQPNY